MRATSLAVVSHYSAHSGVYALVDGILHLLNVQNARFTATCISDDFNAISSKSHSIGGRAFTKGFEYDKARVKKLTGNHGGTLQYEYDAMGRISKEKDSGGNVLKAYTYDSFGQLEWETNYILDKTFQYVYNEIGNLTSVTTYPHVNGVASATGTTKTFTYDGTNPDRLTGYNGKTVPYNSIGYPTTYNGYTLTWTRGKLTRMNAGNRTSGMTTYSYAYNALGQRVSKSFSFLPGKNDSGATLVARMLSSNRNYYYDHSGRLVSEKFFESYENGTIDNTEITYLYDESSMIGLVFNRNGSEGVYYYHRNLQGDVIGIYDTNGTKVVEYAYDAWGNCSTTSATTNYPLASANPIRYRGYYFDVETSWYFLNARYYNPEWRRFISPDDTSYLDPETPNGLNLYCYCGNDPVNYCDPSGHFPFFLLAALCAVGITALVDYIPDQQFNLHCGWYVGAATGGALIGAGAAALLAGAFGASVGSVVTGAMLTHQMIQAAGFTAGGIMLLDNLQNAVNYQTHVFWSGGTLAQDVGANLAKSVQGITLEMTKLGQYLSKLYVSNRGVWTIASENFANQVKNGSTVLWY